MDFKPLGDYEELLRSAPAGWGSGTVTHGSGGVVLDDLIAGIQRHRETATAGYWPDQEPRPVAIGCVPWLTDQSIASALAGLGGCCIVVDKQQPDYAAVRYLAEHGSSLSSVYLSAFADRGLPDQDGSPPVIGPSSGMMPPVDLGPVRVVGWRKADDGRPRPMLHAKLLVLGVATFQEDDEFGQEIFSFDPKTVWLGSANWTMAGRSHIEFGLWSTDPQLVERTFKYLESLLTFSEPRGSSTAGPEPQLVSAVWDNEAFYEYLAEHAPDPADGDSPDDAPDGMSPS